MTIAERIIFDLASDNATDPELRGAKERLETIVKAIDDLGEFLTAAAATRTLPNGVLQILQAYQLPFLGIKDAVECAQARRNFR